MSPYRWAAALALASVALISPVARLLPGGLGTLLIAASSGAILGWAADGFKRTFWGAVPTLAVLVVGLGPTWVSLLTHGVKKGESAVGVHLAFFIIALIPVLAGWLGAVAAWGVRRLKG